MPFYPCHPFESKSFQIYFITMHTPQIKKGAAYAWESITHNFIQQNSFAYLSGSSRYIKQHSKQIRRSRRRASHYLFQERALFR
ncbi:hypothetical protein VCRA2133E348_140009 [Vibrio crassostreae]|nr:hypothetical protein VCRA2133E348_140009 [Vibrio crassostreae]